MHLGQDVPEKLSSNKDIAAAYVNTSGEHPSSAVVADWKRKKACPELPCTKAKFDAFLEGLGSVYAPSVARGERPRTAGRRSSISIRSAGVTDLNEKEQIERIGKLRAQRIQEQIKAKALRGKFIEAAKVKDLFVRAGAETKIAFQALPRSVAGDLLGLEHRSQVEAVLSRAIDEILESLSKLDMEGLKDDG